MGNRLQEAGFNLFSVANNHAGDFGPEGRANTSKVLDSLGIPHAGNIERPYTTFEKDNIVYGFAAFSPNKGTPSINDIATAKGIVQHLDSLVDIVIVSFHGGAEGKDYTAVTRSHEYFYGEDRGDVYGFAHAMVDAGADVIFGHGPHVPRAIDVYNGRFIAYSLGNFATYGRFNLQGTNGLAPIAKIVVNSEGEFLSGQIISCIQTGRGIPQIDPNNAASELINDLTKKDIPEVEITIDETGFISYLHF
jgi:2',3'-cyclic-nucleotide 2'-phosphodiesterase (5'-nucleotidase family)